MDLFDDSPILPPEPDLEVIHDREYRVRSYRKGNERLLLRGAVRDQKPPGLYLEADPEPLTIHHMQVDLEVAFPTLEIVDVHVHFEMHPNETCPTITAHYGNLVGLSIARGFTHKVRELFGGPRGCTHTTALLQAMAPVAIQSIWSMRAAVARSERRAGRELAAPDEQQRAGMWRMNLNTCHIWDEEGEFVQSLAAGATHPTPVFLRARIEKLGIDVSEWNERMGG